MNTFIWQLKADQRSLQLDWKYDESQVQVDDEWNYVHTKIIPSHSTERLVLFRPHPPSPDYPPTPKIGCIRVRDKDDKTKKLWDIVNREGIYMGHVPAGSRFEAMIVDVKLITPK